MWGPWAYPFTEVCFLALIWPWYGQVCPYFYTMSTLSTMGSQDTYTKHHSIFFLHQDLMVKVSSNLCGYAEVPFSRAVINKNIYQIQMLTVWYITFLKHVLELNISLNFEINYLLNWWLSFFHSYVIKEKPFWYPHMSAQTLESLQIKTFLCNCQLWDVDKPCFIPSYQDCVTAIIMLRLSEHSIVNLIAYFSRTHQDKRPCLHSCHLWYSPYITGLDPQR